MTNKVARYQDFLHTAEDGRVWWPLAIAIKLVAGFRPIETIRGLELQVSGNKARALERSLVGAVRKDHGPVRAPKTLRRGNEEVIPARAFLNWYAGYLLETESADLPPRELARAVADAESERLKQPKYQSLSGMLNGFWDRAFDQLPDALIARINAAAPMVPWDNLSPSQREYWAGEWDQKNDPGAEGENEYWWSLAVQRIDIKSEIDEWKGTAAPTALDRIAKEGRLEELELKLRKLEDKFHVPLPAAPNQAKAEAVCPSVASKAVSHGLIPYPKALAVLEAKHGATQSDMVGWLYLRADSGGLAAFLNANELGEDCPFHYGSYFGSGWNYVAPLMATWFRPVDLESFKPQERFVSGAELLARWSEIPGIEPRAFIRAKVSESRLLPFHPIEGPTQWDSPGDQGRPPEDSALFRVSDIREIETSDFPKPKTEALLRPRTGERNALLQQAAEELVRKLRRKDKRKDLSKREVAKRLSQTPEWRDLTEGTIERIIQVNW